MSLSSNKELKVLSVNISEKKGTIKKPVGKAILGTTGVEGDAHSGNWHRMVSLLGSESVERYAKVAGREINFGEFAENITTKGMELFEASPLDIIHNQDIILEVTQIGKKCHGDNCNIFRETGSCVMPKEGIFCRVIKGGSLQEGDSLTYVPKIYKAVVITLSDRASRGEYEDKSGPALATLLSSYAATRKWNLKVINHLIADDAEALQKIITESSDNQADFIFTTGGTGIGPRDITPEVVRPLLHKEIPGIMEHIRIKYGQSKPNALITRSLCGIRDKSLVFCVPGSEKAVREYMEEILLSLQHMVYMLHGLDQH